jgi:hypothetical protein
MRLCWRSVTGVALGWGLDGGCELIDILKLRLGCAADLANHWTSHTVSLSAVFTF